MVFLKVSGVTRRVDELGRIVIPVEIRRLLNIKEGENLEFIINEKKDENEIDENSFLSSRYERGRG